ncbi:MAG: FtsX-like permease family protein, partial [Gammaproteobacteria bacterium]
KAYRVVGVLPDALVFPSAHPATGWVPFPPAAPGLADHVEWGVHALVRPHAGLSEKAVRDALSRAYNEALPGYNEGMRSFIEQTKLVPRVQSLAEREYGPIMTRLQLLEIAALLLMLLVFANLAGLATSDALARRHELATRVALGAGTLRLFAERARELGTLGVMGWAIGIGLGWLGSRALATVIGRAGSTATFSAPVLLLTLAAVLVITTLLAAGGIRRLRTPRVLCADLMSGGHTTGGRGLARALRAFIVLQLVISVVLLVMAGHLRVNVFNLTHGDLGFTSAQRTFLRVALPGGEGDQTEAQYKAYVARASAFDRGFLDRLNGLPGVKSAALLSVMPLSNSSSTTTASTAPVGKQQHGEIINVQKVSEGIAPALGLRVLAGNLKPVFSDGGHAILLDAAAVKRFWPNLAPAAVIGRSLYIGDGARRVAAVVEPLRMKPYGSVGGTMFSSFNASTRSLSGGPQTFVVHSTLSEAAQRSEVAALARQVDPEAKLRGFEPAQALVAKAYAERGHLSQVFGVLAVVALLIAAVGLFALLAYRSLVRRPEFAIRAALGATSSRLRFTVLKEAFLLWLVGCVIGIPVAYVLGRVLAANQPELGLPGSATVVIVLVAVAVITACAALIPARRAARANAATDLHG